MLLITATSVDEHRQSNGKIEKETHSKNGKKENKEPHEQCIIYYE